MRFDARVVVLAVSLFATAAPTAADASERRFDPRVIVVGEAREQLKAVPITQRPYRPLHVYGNSVRRRHQRAVSPAVRRPSSR